MAEGRATVTVVAVLVVTVEVVAGSRFGGEGRDGGYGGMSGGRTGFGGGSECCCGGYGLRCCGDGLYQIAVVYCGGIDGRRKGMPWLWRVLLAFLWLLMVQSAS